MKRSYVMLLAMSLSCLYFSCIEKGPQTTSLDTALIQVMVDGLETGTQIHPITRNAEMEMEIAYQYQKELAKRVTAFRGPVCGYKVAYASQAAQEQFGMTEPARGPFFLIQRVPSGSELSSEVFQEIMLETEIAFTVGKRIDKPINSIDDVKKHIRSVHAAFDAGNFPYSTAEAKAGPQDMIAIGTGAHIFILGPAVSPDALVLRDLTLALLRNGERIRESSAAMVMGDPWNSMLWCANHLVNDGLALDPGMVVLCGTAAPAYRVKGEEIKGEYVGECGSLGQVRMTLN